MTRGMCGLRRVRAVCNERSQAEQMRQRKETQVQVWDNQAHVESSLLPN